MQRLAEIMKTSEVKKALGQRIKAFRKQRGWTQKELAFKLELQISQLNKYEGGLHAPTIDKLVEIAELFDTTLDFLVRGNLEEADQLHDKRLLKRLQGLEKARKEDVESVLNLLDAVLFRQRVQNSVKSLT